MAWADEPLRTYQVPTADAIEWLDPNTGGQGNSPLGWLQTAERGYLETLWDGTGSWEGSGIRGLGMVDPVLLEMDGGSYPLIWDGNHRIAMADLFGLSVVPVQAYDELAERFLQDRGYPWVEG